MKLIKKIIDGETYILNGPVDGQTKKDATQLANWMRRGQFRARLEKLSRGKYRVWSR